MAVERNKHLAEELEGLSPAEQRAYLRPYKRPLGSARARGKRYIGVEDLPTIGAAIEKRANRAIKRRREAGLE